NAALALGEYTAVVDVADRAIVANPLDEEAHRARIQGLYQSGDVAAALAGYEALRTTLGGELGADPSPRSEALYLAILRAEPVPEGGVHVRPTASVAPAHDDALVGRDDELRQLWGRWSAAAGGAPGVVVLAGAVGAGKTRVGAELA